MDPTDSILHLDWDTEGDDDPDMLIFEYEWWRAVALHRHPEGWRWCVNDYDVGSDDSDDYDSDCDEQWFPTWQEAAFDFEQSHPEYTERYLRVKGNGAL